jgi:hypothetical protein
MEPTEDILEKIDQAIDLIKPGIYDTVHVDSLMKIYDIVVAEKEKNPSWQLSSMETRKRKRPKLQ